MSTSVRVPSCSLVGTTKLTRCRGATPIPANRNFKPSKGFNSHHTLRRAAEKPGGTGPSAQIEFSENDNWWREGYHRQESAPGPVSEQRVNRSEHRDLSNGPQDQFDSLHREPETLKPFQRVSESNGKSTKCWTR